MTDQKVKYAILTSSFDPGHGGRIKFDSQTYLAQIDASKLFKHERVSHWKTWLGQLATDSISSEARSFLVTWKEDSAPEVLDAANQALMARINVAWHASILPETMHSEYMRQYAFTGSGTLNDGSVEILDIRNVVTKTRLGRPFYEYDAKDFYEILPYSDPSYVDAWIQCDRALQALVSTKKAYSILFDALESFIDGRTSDNRATSIARFVECAEAIIALGENSKGRTEFAQRATAFLSDIQSDKFLASTSDQASAMLIDLYRIRSARNHGMGQFDLVPKILGTSKRQLKTKEEQDVFADRLARYIYLAEKVAKRAMKHAILSPGAIDYLKSRDLLEQAWKKGAFVSQSAGPVRTN